MGCSCHVAHNTARHAAKAFEKFLISSAEELLVDLFFHFDYSSKRKNLEFCVLFVIKISKNPEVSQCSRWLGLSRCNKGL